MVIFPKDVEVGMLSDLVEYPQARRKLDMIDPAYLSETGQQVYFTIQQNIADEPNELAKKLLMKGIQPKEYNDKMSFTHETAEEYIDKFYAATQRFKLMALLSKNSELLMKDEIDTEKAIEDVWRFQQKAKTALEIKHATHVSHENMDRAEAIWAGKYGDLQWPFEKMNNILNGLMGGELVVIAGQPGMGKSALMGSLAYEWALLGKKSGFVALEMKAIDLQNRLLQRYFAKSLTKEMKYLSYDDRSILAHKAGEFAKLPMYFVDNGNSSLTAVVACIKTMHMMYGIQVAFVDYLQLMRTKGGDNRDIEIGIMTRTLKQLAMELNIPIVIGSQLNRRVNDNPDGRPRLVNLRESGNIEQDADIVMFVYRPIFFAVNGRLGKGEDAITVSENDFEVIIGKQRNGMLGTAYMSYDAAKQIISDRG